MYTFVLDKLPQPVLLLVLAVWRWNWCIMADAYDRWFFPRDCMHTHSWQQHTWLEHQWWPPAWSTPQAWHQLSGQLICPREWDSCRRAWGSWPKGWGSIWGCRGCQACRGFLTPTRCLGPSPQPRSSLRCLHLAVRTPGNGSLVTKTKERGRFSWTFFPSSNLKCILL